MDLSAVGQQGSSGHPAKAIAPKQAASSRDAVDAIPVKLHFFPYSHQARTQQRQPPPLKLREPVRDTSMDSPVVTKLFRQLFRQHPACQRRNIANLAAAVRHNVRRQHAQQHHQTPHGRLLSTSGIRERGGKPAPARNESNWQQRTTLLQRDMKEEYNKYPMVTANDLRARRERPRRVKMLMRDFIEGLFAPICRVGGGEAEEQCAQIR